MCEPHIVHSNTTEDDEAHLVDAGGTPRQATRTGLDPVCHVDVSALVTFVRAADRMFGPTSAVNLVRIDQTGSRTARAFGPGRLGLVFAFVLSRLTAKIGPNRDRRKNVCIV